MRNIYTLLEFNQIRENLMNYANTEISRERIKTLAIIQSKFNLNFELKILDEAICCLLRYGDLPIKSSSNLIQLLDLAEKGGILTPRDFSLIVTDCENAQTLSKHFYRIKNEYSLIGEKVQEFFDLNQTKEKINRIIAPDLTVKNSASSELESIRRKIRRLENEVTTKINNELAKNKDYLSDSSYTLRDGHYVLPILTSYKSKVLGIVHDISDSGATTFIEPSSLVELDNDIYIAKKNEQDEIKKILKELTISILDKKEEIISNNKLIGYLDFVFSKARYANETNSNVGEVSENGELELINARHPLIDPKKVVANTIKLNKTNRMLLISGPNAGGKTVSLKTLGLLAIMNQCAIAIPSEAGSKLPYFKNIFVDIGDNQSLMDNLSTFSGHVRNLSYIIDEVNEGDLVLLDELGTGTSPKEGEAIAYSVIRVLLNKKCYSIISSHFEGLKAYALSNKNIQNASMIFDEKKLQPTYKLRLGIPGKSYGIEMAKRYKMSDEVLLMAKSYLDKEGANFLESAIEKLNLEETSLRNAKEKEKSKLIELEHQLQEANKAKKDYDKKLKEIQKTFQDDRNKLIDAVKEEVDEVIKLLSKPNVKLHEVIEAKAKLENRIDLTEEETSYLDTPISIGTYVEIIDTDFNGKVIRINGEKVDIITSLGLSVSTTKNKLRAIEKPVSKETNYKKSPIIINKPMSSELNVIGLYVDEALPKVMSFLDDARMHNLSEVRVIHGMGSGKLRSAIHDMLKTQKYIKSYTYAPSSLGGSGATIVKLK